MSGAAAGRDGGVGLLSSIATTSSLKYNSKYFDREIDECAGLEMMSSNGNELTRILEKTLGHFGAAFP